EHVLEVLPLLLALGVLDLRLPACTEQRGEEPRLRIELELIDALQPQRLEPFQHLAEVLDLLLEIAGGQRLLQLLEDRQDRGLGPRLASGLPLATATRPTSVPPAAAGRSRSSSI